MGELLGAIVGGWLWVRIARALSAFFPMDRPGYLVIFSYGVPMGLAAISAQWNPVEKVTWYIALHFFFLSFFLWKSYREIAEEEDKHRANTWGLVAILIGVVFVSISRSMTPEDGSAPSTATATATATMPRATATTTATATVPVTNGTATQRSTLSPLQAGEVPPRDAPNFANPKEISRSGLVAFYRTCVETAKKRPDYSILVEESTKTMCKCSADAYRQNFSKSKTKDSESTAPTWEQVNKCASFARGDIYSNPYAPARPQDGMDIALSAHDFCFDGWRETMTTAQLVAFCGCYADFATSGPSPLVSEANRNRCWEIAKYWAETKRHATVRQFNELP